MPPMHTPYLPRTAEALQPGVSRRGFLRISASGLAAAALPTLVAACTGPQTPAAPTSPPPAPTGAAVPPTPGPTVASAAASAPTAVPRSTVGANAGAAAHDPYPRYIPFTAGPKPDYHDDNPIYSDGFETYPASPFKANQSAPGAGSTINVLIAAYFPVPTPYEQNPTWQAVNQQLNADVRMNIIPASDYRTKFATTMASDDLPDIMHLYFGYSVAPNLP